MNWPRGRYNGQQIVGLRITASFVALPSYFAWCWPSMLYGRCLGIGPLRIWFNCEYLDPSTEDKSEDWRSDEDET